MCEHIWKNKIFQYLSNCCFVFLLMILLVSTGEAFENEVIDRDSNISLFYKVDKGYKILLIVKREGRELYRKYREEDISGIEVEFVDFNMDGYKDILLKFSDERGYSPSLLLNDKNKILIEGLRYIDQPIYVITELDVDDEGNVQRPKKYQICDAQAGGEIKIQFFNVKYGNTVNKSISLCYNKNRNSFYKCR